MATRRLIVRRIQRERRFPLYRSTTFAGRTYTSSKTSVDKYAEDRTVIVEGVPMAMRLTIARELFPAMVREMRAIMNDMHSGKNTYPAFFKKRGEDAVYSSFQYTHVSQAKQKSAPLYFRNHSTHVNALIDGVTVANKTFVGNWVKSMARMGKLKTKRIVKRTGKGRWPESPKNKTGKKGWPEIISGVGATSYAITTETNRKIKKYKHKLKQLEQSKAFKGRAKQKRALQRHLQAAQTRGLKESKQKKFSALVKGKSQRDFWTPIVTKYWGRTPTLPPDTAVTVKTETTRGSVAVKELTNSIYYRMKKNISKIKTGK